MTGSHEELSFNGETDLGILIQYPSSLGGIADHAALAKEVQDAGGKVVVAADPMALVMLEAPGHWGADIVVGSMQRFGVPMGFGGPHAAYMAASDAFKRQMPGRIVGQSIDAEGNPALRLALQTREQHIRRDKATSNICTAQVLLAVMASMYAVYHGPKGLRRIATRIHEHAVALGNGLKALGFELAHHSYFDTVAVKVTEEEKSAVIASLAKARMNLRTDPAGHLAISTDELSTAAELTAILESFAGAKGTTFGGEFSIEGATENFGSVARKSVILSQEAFNSHHSETELLRYMAQLASQGCFACNLHDSARFMYDEAKRNQRDDSCHLARVLRPSSICTQRADPGLSPDVRGTRVRYCGDHWASCSLAATECWLSGRIRRDVGDPRISPCEWRHRSDDLSHSAIRSWDEPSERNHGRDESCRYQV